MKNFKNYIFDLGGVLLDINMQNALDGFRALGVPEKELRFDEGETARIMQNYQLGLLTTDQFCDAIASRCKGNAVPNSKADAIGPTNNGTSAKPSRKQVADAWNSICLNIPQRKIDALRTLKEKANIYLLSNTNDLHWIYCLEHWFNVGCGTFGKNNVDACFHHIFLSQEMHLEKPNPEIFKQAIREISAMQTLDTTNPMKSNRDAISQPSQTRDAADLTYKNCDAANSKSKNCGEINLTIKDFGTITPENTIFLDDNLANVEAARSCGISAIHVTPDFDWVQNLL